MRQKADCVPKERNGEHRAVDEEDVEESGDSEVVVDMLG